MQTMSVIICYYKGMGNVDFSHLFLHVILRARNSPVMSDGLSMLRDSHLKIGDIVILVVGSA